MRSSIAEDRNVDVLLEDGNVSGTSCVYVDVLTNISDDPNQLPLWQHLEDPESWKSFRETGQFYSGFGAIADLGKYDSEKRRIVFAFVDLNIEAEPKRLPRMKIPVKRDGDTYSVEGYFLQSEVAV